MDDEYDNVLDEITADELAVLEAAERAHYAASQRPASQVAPPRPAVAKKAILIKRPSEERIHFRETSRPVSASNGVNNLAPSGKARQPGQLPFRGRPPTKPVYRDDFPDVEVTADGKYVNRTAAETSRNGQLATAKHDEEMERMRKEVDKLQAELAEVRRANMRTAGEATMMRNSVAKAEKEHQTVLEAERLKAATLQDQIAALQRAATEDKQRYKSEILFARQEHESSVRQQRSGSLHPSTAMKHRINQVGFSQSQFLKPKRQSPRRPAPQKGFANSFFESPPRQARGQTAQLLNSSPNVPPNATTPSANGSPKGKQPADAAYPDFEGNDLDLDLDVRDEVTHQPAEDEEDEETDPIVNVSTREAAVTFIFGHRQVFGSHAGDLSLQTMVHCALHDRTDLDDEEHRRICQDLYESVGNQSHPSTSNDTVQQHDRLFLTRVISIILRFGKLFHRKGMEAHLITALYFMHDLLSEFWALLFHQPIILPLHREVLKDLFASIVSFAKSSITAIVQRCDAKLNLAKHAKPVQARTVHAAAFSRVARDTPSIAHTERSQAERSMEPIVAAIMDVLMLLAWRPDEDCLTNFDGLLRDKELLAMLLELRRSPRVLLQTLDLLALLGYQPTLFRTIIAIPLQNNLSKPLPNPQIALVEIMTAFLLYRASSPENNRSIHRAALLLFSTLAVQHADGVPLLGQSSLLIQRIILRIAQEAGTLYEYGHAPAGLNASAHVVSCIANSLQLLHFLLYSPNTAKTLSEHLSERPLSQDYFVTGIGRIAFTRVPEWLDEESQQLADTMESLAELAHDILRDILVPEELGMLYELCKDEEEDEDEAERNTAKDDMLDEGDDDEVEQLAANNVDAIER